MTMYTIDDILRMKEGREPLKIFHIWNRFQI